MANDKRDQKVSLRIVFVQVNKFWPITVIRHLPDLVRSRP